MLRIIAGLEDLQQGRINVDGRVVADETVNVPPEDRSVSLLFQDFALFPHLTVYDNVVFGLTHLSASPTCRPRNAASGWSRCWNRWACWIAPICTRTCCPAASSNASRWRGRGRRGRG